jgi:uncharacterized delta-60 repeat protein
MWTIRFRAALAFSGALCLCAAIPSSGLAAPGALDPGFGSEGTRTTDFDTLTDSITAIALQGDKIVVAGSCFITPPPINGVTPPPTGDFCLARYLRDGTLDPTFGVGGQVTTAIGAGNDQALAVAIADGPDGQIVVAGKCADPTGTRFCVARYTNNGVLDTSFGGGAGTVIYDKLGSTFSNSEGATAVVIQASGKIVVAGQCRGTRNIDFCLVRYDEITSDHLDPSFGSPLGTLGTGIVVAPIGTQDDFAAALAVQGGGLVVGGGCNDIVDGAPIGRFCLARFTSDGLPDYTFSDTPDENKVLTLIDERSSALALITVAGDKIVVAGQCVVQGSGDFCLARYTSNGVLDTSFNDRGTITTTISPGSDRATAVAVGPGGEIVAAGQCFIGTISNFCLAGYTKDGSLDTHFGNSGTIVTAIGSVTANSAAAAVAVQADGKIVAAGFCTPGSTQADFCLAGYEGSSSGAAPPDEEVSQVGTAGGIVTTDGEGDGATPADPLETSVFTPNAGLVTLTEGPTSASAPGYAFFSQQVQITAPAGSASSPLKLEFRIDASQFPAGQTAANIVVFRNGTPVPPCTGPAAVASPDPCVASLSTLSDSDGLITVFTSAASLWTFALQDCGGDCSGDGEVTVNELVLSVNIALGTASVDRCPASDSNNDGEVTINELIAGVRNALNGCPAAVPTVAATAPATV